MEKLEKQEDDNLSVMNEKLAKLATYEEKNHRVEMAEYGKMLESQMQEKKRISDQEKLSQNWQTNEMNIELNLFYERESQKK